MNLVFEMNTFVVKNNYCLMSYREEFSEETQNWYAKGYFSLVKIAGLIDVKLKQTLRPYGITHAQLNILSILVKNYPETLDAKSIKEQLIVQSPDLTRLLDRMVKKNLVTRETCSENRRKIDITATDKGVTLFYEVHEMAKKSVNNYFKDNIEETEAEKLFQILNKIQL